MALEIVLLLEGNLLLAFFLLNFYFFLDPCYAFALPNQSL